MGAAPEEMVRGSGSPPHPISLEPGRVYCLSVRLLLVHDWCANAYQMYSDQAAALAALLQEAP